MFLHVSGSVIVKCAQQGTRLSVKMKDLTSENCELIKKSQLCKGASLMADYKGKTYPVIFEAFAGEYQISVELIYTQTIWSA